MMESVTIALPNRPITIIHKGWVPSKKCRNVIKSISAVDQPDFETLTFSISSQEGQSSAAKLPKEGTPLLNQSIFTTRPWRTGQQIDFVNNASEPLHTKDAAVRKLVRSHAMKEVARQRREQKKVKLNDANAKCEEIGGANERSSQSERPGDRAPGDDVISGSSARDQRVPCALIRPEIDYCFTDYLSEIQAKTRRLASVYLTQVGSPVFPIEFHLAYNPPMQLSSLDSSFTNDVVFRSLFYAAAVCSTLAEGKRNSSEVTAQMGMTIWSINQLLQEGMGTVDGMLGAVCHLAMGEALRGNFNDWAVHMTGLKKMVEMRGGIDKIHFYLQMKIYRADLLGSIDQVSSPFFHFDGSYRRPIYTKTYLPGYDTSANPPTAHTRLHVLLPQLVNVLAQLREFSETIEQTLLTPEARLDPKEFIEAWYSIQYQLLNGEQFEDISDGGFIHEKNALREAFRLGAIIYTKEILQEFTFSAIGSGILVSKLKNSLEPVLASEVTPTSSSLLLWLLLMGGVASTTDNSIDHTFFVAHLVTLRREPWLDEWEDVKERLEDVLWIGKVLDGAGKSLWEEVRLTAKVLGW